ncbi:uncharacterized protein LOC129592745 [Paramacrobiotus metropolitanus]|uniref:uncharacterized protein LOC129592745 n=1 Tax=Paramacrobiotus metropolitanus TaxID=2943436 RepID=UPI0024463CFA|nr:uncharacterized protein LOC129592745 [Paramacrobiotus metropolitanus]
MCLGNVVRQCMPNICHNVVKDCLGSLLRTFTMNFGMKTFIFLVLLSFIVHSQASFIPPSEWCCMLADEIARSYKACERIMCKPEDLGMEQITLPTIPSTTTTGDPATALPNNRSSHSHTIILPLPIPIPDFPDTPGNQTHKYHADIRITVDTNQT